MFMCSMTKESMKGDDIYVYVFNDKGIKGYLCLSMKGIKDDIYVYVFNDKGINKRRYLCLCVQ